MKTALAPTIELATPKVERFIEKLRQSFGASTEIITFYKCDPSESYVEDRKGNKWVEGNWGVELKAYSFSLNDMETLNHLSEVIEIGDISITPISNNNIKVNVWLCARVMRG
jgi:hypothetical protein